MWLFIHWSLEKNSTLGIWRHELMSFNLGKNISSLYYLPVVFEKNCYTNNNNSTIMRVRGNKPKQNGTKKMTMTNIFMFTYTHNQLEKWKVKMELFHKKKKNLKVSSIVLFYCRTFCCCLYVLLIDHMLVFRSAFALPLSVLPWNCYRMFTRSYHLFKMCSVNSAWEVSDKKVK